MGLMGLPDLPVDTPVAQDAEHGREGHEDQDAEDQDHSDETFDLVSVHGHHCRAGCSLP
jgi:hypothetical protein